MENRILPQAVRAQLAKILASAAFVQARRMQRFLEFIVEETLADRADQLGEYGIGLAVFDRGTDFEPALDPIVRNDARRLRTKLQEYYREAHSRTGDVLIEIPKGGYVPVFHAVADDHPPAAMHLTPRRLAVLPFEAIPAAPETGMWGRTIGMALTAGLTNVEGLDAIAHGFLGEQPVRETASELQLSHVINGCIWKSGDRCRVIVNLIQAAQGKQIWAREYDIEAGEMPMVHSTIIAQVLQEVIARLELQPSRPRVLAMAA